METTESPIVVGVFRERALAEQAVNELRHAGFRDDQIRYSGKGAMAGGLLETLMSKFSGQEDGSGSLCGDLEPDRSKCVKKSRFSSVKAPRQPRFPLKLNPARSR